MKTVKLKLTGIRPLIVHNGLMADPTNAAVRRIKEITSKGTKKMTDADYEMRDRLEWEAGLYWDDQLGAVMPSDNIERCIQQGAQKSRIGKDVQASVFCSDPVYKIDYKGPKDIEAMYEHPSFSIRKGVKVQTARIIRIRPMFPVGWSITADIEFDELILNEKSVVKSLEDAGMRIGLGDWRPKFGRFIVEQV